MWKKNQKAYYLEYWDRFISENNARIDFIYGEHISSLFEEILAQYNKIIEEDRVIQTGFSDEANQRRFWKIDGFAKVPCGACNSIS